MAVKTQAQIEKELVLEKCSKSIELFVRLFMEKAAYAQTPDFHKAIYADLEDDSIKRLGIIAPRGHSKSTVVSVFYVLWKICNNPPDDDYFAIIISEAKDQAVNFLTIIRNNLEHNKLLRAYYGNLVGAKWNEEELVTKNSCRILAKGTGQKIRGMIMGKETITRPKDIIMDDFESETNSNTPDLIDKNIKWITKAVEPSLADGGRLITIGTIVHERAYLNRLKDDPEFKVHFYQAITGAKGADLTVGKPLWPERFSMDLLLRKKASYEARGEHDAFWQEFMNIPISLNRQTFPPDKNKIYDGPFELKNGRPCVLVNNMWTPVVVGVGIDPAISIKPTSDFSVIAALGTDYNDNKYLLHYERIKTNQVSELVDLIFEVVEAYGAEAVNIETIQFQEIIAVEFINQMEIRNKHIGVVESKPSTSKTSRIKSLQPLFNAGRFYHRSWMTDFENELFAFPNAAHDDILDAVWYANQITYPAESEGLIIEKDNNIVTMSEYLEEPSWMVL